MDSALDFDIDNTDGVSEKGSESKLIIDNTDGISEKGSESKLRY